MLIHYLLVTFRNLNRHRGYAAINVFGLAVGITCCLLIALFVRNEVAFDRHHEHADRIVRVTTQYSDVAFPATANVVAPIARREIPEVEEAVRLFDSGIFGSSVVQYGEQMFEEDRFFYADSTVFEVFTLPLASGDPRTALTRPRTVVLTESAARKYFGDEDPVGRMLLKNQVEFEVTGVLAPLPPTSHIEFDFLASFSSLTTSARDEIWTSANFLTYLLVRDPDAIATLPAKLEQVIDRARAGGAPIEPGFALPIEPLQTIHLDVAGRRTYVYLFSAIAVLILLIACVNYMNLATARATSRAREVGVRKASGALRAQLIGQFYGESALLAGLGVALAALLATVLMPVFQAISGHELTFNVLDPLVIGTLLVIGLLVTLVAGSYPALLLSGFEPSRVLKGTTRTARGATTFRRCLVAFQFAVSVFLLVGTAVIFSQLRYIQSTDLGFRGEQVVALPSGDRHTLEVLPSVKQRVLEQPGVVSAAAIDRLPGMSPGGYGLIAEGFELPAGMDYYPLHAVLTEPGVVETLGLELLAGADFCITESYQPEPGDYQYLINEAVLRATGWTPVDAIGRRMTVSGDGRWGTVVGVFRDYHFLPLREAVGPLALFVEPSGANNLLVRIAPGDMPATLERLDAVWKEHVPHRPFTYTVLDDAFAAHYASERQLGSLVGAFALLAVLIACMGLLGLAAYAAERRRREIGVRKVLGARTADVVVLLSKEFAVLVALGFAVASPLAYIATNRWLDGFAYRVDLGLDVFMVAGAVVLVLAVLTVSGQALRAATTDPAQAIRSE
jgi:putative ABC transport system permease protein